MYIDRLTCQDRQINIYINEHIVAVLVECKQLKSQTKTDRWPSSHDWLLSGETFQPGGPASPAYGSL